MVILQVTVPSPDDKPMRLWTEGKRVEEPELSDFSFAKLHNAPEWKFKRQQKEKNLFFLLKMNIKRRSSQSGDDQTSSKRTRFLFVWRLILVCDSYDDEKDKNEIKIRER